MSLRRGRTRSCCSHALPGRWTPPPLGPLGDTWPLACSHLPDPLPRLLRAARALPRLVDVVECDAPLQLGDWCLAAPLWGNPLLLSQGAGLEYDFLDVACLPGEVETLGDVFWLLSLLARQPTVLPATFYNAHFSPHVAFRVRDHAVTRLRGLLAAVPGAWVTAARVALSWRPVDPRPRPAAAWSVILPRLGWLWEVTAVSPPKGVALLCGLTVRAATWLLLCAPGGLHARRAERLAAFALAAGRPASAEPVLQAFALLWRVRWDNKRKEVFWRLAYDGLPTAVRCHFPDCSCPCGAPRADREHHFWDCTVAAAVVQEVEAAAAGVGRPLLTPLQRHQVWLAIAPTGVNAGVWAVVVLAVVTAMEQGRRTLVAQRLAGASAGPALAAVAARRAVRRFWEALYDFAALRELPPRGGGAPLDGAHPFLCLHGGSVPGVRVHRP